MNKIIGVVSAIIIGACPAIADEAPIVVDGHAYTGPFQPFGQAFTWERVENPVSCVVVDPKGKEDATVEVGLFGYPDDDSALVVSCKVTRDGRVLKMLREERQQQDSQGSKL